MNENSTKKILFNKSTLLSLKAELLRKQEEVNEKKKQSHNKIENFKPTVKKKEPRNENNEGKKTFRDSLKAVDTEELEACRKAKSALEKKAELYEHLSNPTGESQLAGRFLVDFKTKKQQEPAKETVYDEPDSDTEEPGPSLDDDEWTEFTDCLGRTRKCHKSDLDLYKKRDQDLMRSMNATKDGNDLETEELPPLKEKPLLVQKTNDYLQSLRDKWEQKENELLAKDKDIHYQDLLFDEARIHGVGYFAFSTDESERKKQMEELIKARQETLKAQQEAEKVRLKRDAMISARVAAARARQRERDGLPPEDPAKEGEKDFTEHLLEFLTQQKNEADAKAKAIENKIKEEQEKEKQKLREAHVREWDVGKQGVEGKVKKFREMTQDEYVEQQRDKRIEEFAPPRATTSKNSNVFDDTGKVLAVANTPKTWADVRPQPKTPPPPDIGELTEVEKKGLYFSSKKGTNAVKYRNFVRAQEPTPIIDELAADSTSVDNRQVYVETEISQSRTGTEIPPPPTFEYFGPVLKHVKSNKPFESDIREAYAQGTKSLEAKSSNRQLSKNYDFTFD